MTNEELNKKVEEFKKELEALRLEFPPQLLEIAKLFFLQKEREEKED